MCLGKLKTQAASFKGAADVLTFLFAYGYRADDVQGRQALIGLNSVDYLNGISLSLMAKIVDRIRL